MMNGKNFTPFTEVSLDVAFFTNILSLLLLCSSAVDDTFCEHLERCSKQKLHEK